MAKKVIFWCEFPKKVNWAKVKKLIDFETEIYIAVKTRKEFEKYKKLIKNKYIDVGAWPVLSKKEGYWFSGFTSRKNIDKLDQFKNLKLKIDLEPPFPKWRYTHLRMLWWLVRLTFKRSENAEYLQNKISELSKKSKLGVVLSNTQIMANEFPFYKFYLKRFGLYTKGKNITKNFMCYSTFSSFFRPLVIVYLKYWMKKAIKENKNVSFSLGLIGPGILKTEKYYKNIEHFKQDIELVKKIKAEKIAIYSIETLIGRKNPEKWLSILKDYISSF